MCIVQSRISSGRTDTFFRKALVQLGANRQRALHHPSARLRYARGLARARVKYVLLAK